MRGPSSFAALAPGDRTPEGFDQFRFWYHLDLSPFMTDERAMLATRGSPKTLRGTRLPRTGGEIRDRLDPSTLAADANAWPEVVATVRRQMASLVGPGAVRSPLD